MKTNTRVKIVSPYDGPHLGKTGSVVCHKFNDWGEAVAVEIDGWGLEWFSPIYLEEAKHGNS